MNKFARILAAIFVAVLGLGLLHGVLNLGWGKPRQVERYRVGFLPVTCHLTCPVTDWINKSRAGQGLYEPVRFSGWPELKEAFISGHNEASFMLAPMAMALREQGVKLKIVYLGHRDGSALMVRKDSPFRRIEDLRGKSIAVPNRFSNQRLIIYKALKDRGLTLDDVKLLEMPPPDMPAALYAGAVDAIISGEPFMGQTELDGYGRVLYQAKELWPGFISCVLVVSEKMIAEHPGQVQELVDGIAESGLWLDQTMEHRMKAAETVATRYYNQDPRLLRFVLSKPPDRVTYTRLKLARQDFEEIEQLARETGVIDGPISFDDYADIRFSEKTQGLKPHPWEPK